MVRFHGTALLLAGLALSAWAESPEDAFSARFSSLSRQLGLVEIELGALPAATPVARELPSTELPALPELPALLSAEDVRSVVVSQRVALERCLGRAAEPFVSDAILNLSVRRTGRVGAISIEPRVLERSPLGECLLSVVPRWTFPKFSGELESGVQQEAINASVPLRFKR